MLRWLARLLPGSRAARLPALDHPVLGTLQFTPDLAAWRTVVSTDAGRIGFLIAGDTSPNEQLLRHAEELVTSDREFLDTVRQFLFAEAKTQPRWAGEILALSLEEVCLFWPDRPNDGMLYFKGSDENRVWRSDYRNRQPQGLGFDS